MVTRVEEFEVEIKAMREENDQLEDTPENFFEQAPYLFQSILGERFAANIEADSVTFTTDDSAWGKKLLRFSKAEAEEALTQLTLEMRGELTTEDINMNNPLNKILISTGETLFFVSVLQTAMEKWKCVNH